MLYFIQTCLDFNLSILDMKSITVYAVPVFNIYVHSQFSDFVAEHDTGKNCNLNNTGLNL